MQIEVLIKAVNLAPNAGELHYYLEMAYAEREGDLDNAKQASKDCSSI